MPHLDVGYARELLDTAPAGAIAVGGGSFTATALEPARDQVTLGGGLAVTMDDSLSLYGDYQAVLPTGNSFSHTLEAGLSWRF